MPHEPKKRHSRARQGKRRASIKLQVPGIVVCPNCKATIYPHTICKKCGFYNGKQVLTVDKVEVRKVKSA
jgi:large subunit ribosomal protein L32